MPKLLSKTLFISCREGRPVFPGFVSYIHSEKPVLLGRYGWVDGSDTYADYGDSWSYDNGKTWTDHKVVLESKQVSGGKIRYGDLGAIYDSERGKLMAIAGKSFFPEDLYDVDQRTVLEIMVYDSTSETWTTAFEGDFRFGAAGLAVNFPFPVQLSSGRILIPAMRLVIGADGRAVHYPGCSEPRYQSLVVIGEFDAEGRLGVRPGGAVAVDPEKSTRGFSENTLVELSDGRVAMVIRGSNDSWPEKLGCKWMAFSADQGESWSDPQPWIYDDGSPLESPSSGSAIFRSIKNGKVFWMGNICTNGEKAYANNPRSPLVIGEVQEDPFALKRGTLTVIDERSAGDSPAVQFSNFRYYQDRWTGEVVLFLSRFGERSAEEWKRADYYQYRLALE
jgi:hypothetical protein